MTMKPALQIYLIITNLWKLKKKRGEKIDHINTHTQSWWIINDFVQAAQPWVINGAKVQGDFCNNAIIYRQQRRSQIMEGLVPTNSLLMLEHAIFIARWFSRERPKIFEPDTQTKGTLDNGLFQSGSILKYVVVLTSVVSLLRKWEKISTPVFFLYFPAIHLEIFADGPASAAVCRVIRKWI